MPDTYDDKKKFGSNCIGHVIRILDNHSLIINVGQLDGISKDDIIQVYEYLGPLKDLDGKELGPLEYVKAELFVIRSEDEYAICKTSTYRKSPLPMPKGTSPLLYGEKTHYTFPIKNNELEPLTPTDSTVHVGDPVKKS